MRGYTEFTGNSEQAKARELSSLTNRKQKSATVLSTSESRTRVVDQNLWLFISAQLPVPCEQRDCVVGASHRDRGIESLRGLLSDCHTILLPPAPLNILRIALVCQLKRSASSRSKKPQPAPIAVDAERWSP